jgi:methyl-accepting chemotaxis protein
LLGEDVIKQKAVDVAKQMEIYLRSNPTLTVADLQNDSYFQGVAVQRVGKTGYTAITDVDTLICRFHSNPKIANLDLSTLSGKLPGFWSVMEKSKGGKEVWGYYDWAEADGSIKQKYMHIAIVGAKTADGVVFSVAATTYIDEFSSPVKLTEAKIKNSVDNTVVKIKNSTEGLQTGNTILIITLLTLIAVIIISFLLAKSISEPVENLKKAADSATDGNFDIVLPKSNNIEISSLTASVEMLISALRHKASK